MDGNMLGVRRPRAVDERGVALIEFVLVLPLVLLLLFAMIDFGKAFNYWNDETHLANEAARYAVVNKNPLGGGSLEAAVKDDADSGELKNGCSGCSIEGPGVKVSFCFPKVDPVTGQPVTTAGAPLRATVTTSYHWLAYLVGQGLPLTSGLTSSATMRLEQDYNSADPAQNKYLNGSSPDSPLGPVPC
jgi:Flp pilus assembly protein TadG